MLYVVKLFFFLSLILHQMFLCNFQTVAYTAESCWKYRSCSAAICICGRLVISFKYWSKYLLVMFLTSHQWNNLKMFGNPANHLATSPVRLLKITTYKLDVQRSWVKQSMKMYETYSTLNNINMKYCTGWNHWQDSRVFSSWNNSHSKESSWAYFQYWQVVAQCEIHVYVELETFK